MIRSTRRHLGRALVLGVAVLVPLGSLALADSVDTTMPRTLTVGDPKGIAASDRVDAKRSGRSKTRLPSSAIEAWRFPLKQQLEVLPVVDDAGNVIVAMSSGDVISVGADGKERWRLSTGKSAPAASPVLTSDGTFVVASIAGQVTGVTPAGAVRYSVSLGARSREESSMVALKSGGVALASGTTLFELGGDGSVKSRTTLSERASGAILETTEGLVTTSDTGAVYAWKSPLGPRKLGTFGGALRRGAALGDARTLLAIVDDRRLVAFDLPTGAAHVRSTASQTYYDGPVAVSGAIAYFTAETGLLVGVDASGNERVHVAIEKSVLSGDAGTGFGALFVQPDKKESKPVIVDPDGRIAFVRASGRLGLVAPEGNVTVVNERVCSTPLGVQPAGDKRMLVTCRDNGSGTLWMMGE